MSNRPGSAARRNVPLAPNANPQQKPPGTATRLSSAMVRPGTKSGASLPNQNVVLNPTRVDDRPMTRGGLGGQQEGQSGANGGFNNRRVQDKTYFMGILRSKLTEISNEVVRMNKEMNSINSDNANYQSYNRKAEELAQQIEDSLNELSDYNTLLDRLNISSNMQDIQKDYLILKAQNDEQSKELDEYFIEKTKKEELIKQIERDIEQEKKKREKILLQLNGSVRNKYEKIKVDSDRLIEQMNKQQMEIDKYKDRVETMKEQISLSTIKLEAASLLDNLYEYELKREQLKEELSSLNKFNSPEEEREHLLRQVKQDNLEIVTIEKQINELRENIESIKRDLDEEKIDSSKSGSGSGGIDEEDVKKYKELKKRELQMDEFMATYDENKRSEIDLLQQTRKNINGLLETISKYLLRTQQSSNSLNNNNGKDSQLKMSDLNKVNELEQQVKKELNELKLKLERMKDELIMYNDLDELKQKSDERKQQLVIEKQNLTKYKENIKYEIETLHMQVQSIEAQLNDNETHNQLCSLEKKLQIIEQQNYTLKEAINQYQASSSYENMKQKVMLLLQEHNKWLQEQSQNPSYNS